MTRVQIAVRAVPAAAVSGALCALGFLMVFFAIETVAGGQDSEPIGWAAMLMVWLVGGAPIGVVTGLVLGFVPVAVSVAAWPATEERFGTRRGIDAVVLFVGAISFAETLFVAWAFEAAPREAAGWGLGAAVVSALTLRWLLCRGWRSSSRAGRRV